MRMASSSASYTCENFVELTMRLPDRKGKLWAPRRKLAEYTPLTTRCHAKEGEYLKKAWTLTNSKDGIDAKRRVEFGAIDVAPEWCLCEFEYSRVFVNATYSVMTADRRRPLDSNPECVSIDSDGETGTGRDRWRNAPTG